MTVLVLREDTSLDTDQNLYIDNIGEIQYSGHHKDFCQRFSNAMPAPVVVVERADEQVDYLKRSLLLVSDRMKELIESYGIPSQFVECDVKTHEGTAAECAYHYCNVLDEVDCFDPQLSKFHGDRYVAEIEELVVKEERAEGHHLFLLGPRLKKGGDNRGRISSVIYCVSDILATDMLARGFTNVAFCLPIYWDVYPSKAVSWTPE